MPKVYAVMAVMICLSGFGSAQTKSTQTLSSDTVPKVEVYGGYAYTRWVTRFGSNYNGWEGSGSWNFNRWLAAKVDFGGQYYSQSTPEITIPTPFGPDVLPAETFHDRIHTFMAGPEISYRRPRWKVFGHALVGAAHESTSVEINNPPPGLTIIGHLGFSNTGSAFALGGGADWMFSRRFGWRVAQADYLLERVNHTNRNNLQVSTGLVFHFGQK
jgi:hypothetical protein